MLADLCLLSLYHETIFIMCVLLLFLCVAVKSVIICAYERTKVLEKILETCVFVLVGIGIERGLEYTQIQFENWDEFFCSQICEGITWEY